MGEGRVQYTLKARMPWHLFSKDEKAAPRPSRSSSSGCFLAGKVRGNWCSTAFTIPGTGPASSHLHAQPEPVGERIFGQLENLGFRQILKDHTTTESFMKPGFRKDTFRVMPLTAMYIEQHVYCSLI